MTVACSQPAAPASDPPTVPISEQAPLADVDPEPVEPVMPKTAKPEPMDNERLDAVLSELHPVQRHGNVWKMSIAGLGVVCVTDETHDRMRIMTPITDASTMTAKQKDQVLEANFHSALDARYAISDGVLFSAFIHPLSPLTPGEVKSALQQVVSLALTYDSSYSSGNLTFGRP